MLVFSGLLNYGHKKTAAWQRRLIYIYTFNMFVSQQTTENDRTIERGKVYMTTSHYIKHFQYKFSFITINSGDRV